MSDVIDQAQAYDAQNLEQALDIQRRIAEGTPRLMARGYCHNPRCEDEFPPGDQRLFCGPECADEHHRIINRR